MHAGNCTAANVTLASIEEAIAELTLANIGTCAKKIVFHSEEDMHRQFRAAGKPLPLRMAYDAGDLGGDPDPALGYSRARFTGIPVEFDETVRPGTYKMPKRLA